MGKGAGQTDRVRSIWRNLVGLMLARTARARLAGVRRVFFTDGLWVTGYRDGFIVADEPLVRDRLIDYDDFTHDVWEGAYTPTVGDVVVDVGAGIGTEIHRWSRSVGPTGRVIAIEAHPRTFHQLRVFCTLNRLDNVTPIHRAVSDGSGMVRISDDENYLAASIVGTSGEIEVACESLDDLLAGLGIERVDYLKMNIEGAEVAALHGMGRTLERLGTTCVSCHDFRADWGHGEHFRTRAEVTDVLRRAGYEVSARGDDPRAEVRDQVNGRRIASVLR